jgi:hypothetical protein
MKTELDLLVETLARLEREHTTYNKAMDARLTDLAGRLEQWALQLSSVRTQLTALVALLERSGRDGNRR